MTEWTHLPIESVLKRVRREKSRKLFARDYLSIGAIPVVDQGQAPIAGWTDDESLAIKEELPLIVFGDHTRAFKFVDFPFAVGADGTQLLKPIEDFEPRFFFYACLAIELPNRGYNRHFSLLKEKTIPKPELSEQKMIAALLRLVERAIEVEEKLITTARELKQAAMRQLFTRGTKGEEQTASVLGPLPKSWDVRQLSDVATLERGRFLHRPRNEPRFYGGATPFVQTGDVVRSSGSIRGHTQTLNEDGVAISRVFPRGTLLITIAANIGYTGVLEFDSACPDSLVGVTPGPSVDVRYLEYFLQTQRQEMDRLAPKGTQKNINIQFLNPWHVAIPSFDEQLEIAQALQKFDAKISVHEQKQETLQDLFKNLLLQLMTGQIRLNDLNIDVTEVAA